MALVERGFLTLGVVLLAAGPIIGAGQSQRLPGTLDVLPSRAVTLPTPPGLRVTVPELRRLGDRKIFAPASVEADLPAAFDGHPLASVEVRGLCAQSRCARA